MPSFRLALLVGRCTMSPSAHPKQGQGVWGTLVRGGRYRAVFSECAKQRLEYGRCVHGSVGNRNSLVDIWNMTEDARCSGSDVVLNQIKQLTRVACAQWLVPAKNRNWASTPNWRLWPLLLIVVTVTVVGTFCQKCQETADRFTPWQTAKWHQFPLTNKVLVWNTRPYRRWAPEKGRKKYIRTNVVSVGMDGWN